MTMVLVRIKGENIGDAISMQLLVFRYEFRAYIDRKFEGFDRG